MNNFEKLPFIKRQKIICSKLDICIQIGIVVAILGLLLRVILDPTTSDSYIVYLLNFLNSGAALCTLLIVPSNKHVSRIFGIFLELVSYRFKGIDSECVHIEKIDALGRVTTVIMDPIEFLSKSEHRPYIFSNGFSDSPVDYSLQKIENYKVWVKYNL